MLCNLFAKKYLPMQILNKFKINKTSAKVFIIQHFSIENLHKIKFIFVSEC